MGRSAARKLLAQAKLCGFFDAQPGLDRRSECLCKSHYLLRSTIYMILMCTFCFPRYSSILLNPCSTGDLCTNLN